MLHIIRYKKISYVPTKLIPINLKYILYVGI